MTSTAQLKHQAGSIFPNLHIEAEERCTGRAIAFRKVGRYPITRLQVSACNVDAIGRLAKAAGIGRHLKLIWQLSGSMRYEDQDRRLDLRAGDMLVSAVGADYHLEMGERHDALVLLFDPGLHSRWNDRAADSLGIVMAETAATATAAAGAQMLLARASDRSAELAMEAMIDLALEAASPEMTPSGSPPLSVPALIARARLQVLHNIADPQFDSVALARALGMSRRSLYARLAEHGMTPARLIRQVRLDRARQAIAADDGRSMMAIALAHGFADGSSLSHLFKAEYGQTPTSLRDGARQAATKSTEKHAGTSACTLRQAGVRRRD
jgi:AraC family transcriptional activator of tynA and feaB